jgi:hypothetical protein
LALFSSRVMRDCELPEDAEDTEPEMLETPVCQHTVMHVLCCHLTFDHVLPLVGGHDLALPRELDLGIVPVPIRPEVCALLFGVFERCTWAGLTPKAGG